MKSNRVLLAVGICAALTASAYTDGEVIAHFPFDSDYLSIANTSCNPSSVETFGTVSAGSSDVKAAAVYSPDAGSIRSNAGCLAINKGRVAIDITNFNLDSDHARYFTIEFLFKGNESEISEWSRMVLIGNASSVDGTSAMNSPYILELARHSDHFYAKIQNDQSDTSFASPSDAKGYDGEWHHLAYVFNKYTATQDRSYFYVDGVLKSTIWSGDGKYFAWPKPGEGERQYLVLGSNTGSMKCLIDELRITAGSLTTGQFLKLTNDTTTPVDGETLMYLSLDNSLESTAHAEWTPILRSGSVTYDEDVWLSHVRTVVGTEVVQKKNRACVKSTSATRAVVECPYWGLHEGQLTSATIEFFIRGLGTELDWGTPVGFEGGGSGYPLLIQIPTGRFYMRMDACTLIEGNTANANGYESFVGYVPAEKGIPTDGRWHHVAFTVSPLATGASEITFYFDYAPIKSFASTSYAWRGIRASDCLNLAKNCGANVDEIRITKGVLPVDKFLKAYASGIALFVR